MNTISQKIVALLGPTNTGKTHVAIEKMLEFDSGIFGLPLRLLAREIYDKCVDKIGAEKVALITGEEKIIPSTADYYVCTVVWRWWMEVRFSCCAKKTKQIFIKPKVFS